MENNLLTAKQVAEKLGVNYTTVHWYVKQGRLDAVILTKGIKRRTVRFDPAEVQRFVQAGGNKRKSKWQELAEEAEYWFQKLTGLV